MQQTFATPPTQVTADYLVIVSNEDDYHASFAHFSDKVNRKLRAGYQLHGQPFNINQTLCQAMVRAEGAQASGETTVFYKRHEESHLM